MNNISVEKLFQRNFYMVYLQSVSLVDSYKKIVQISPLNESSFTSSDDDKYLIDAFIFRFGRLQDMVGSKVFKGLLELEKEKVGLMRDTLNKMEKIKILEHVSDWDEMREVRNSVIHDYDDDYVKLSQDVNAMIDLVPDLLGIVKKVFFYVRDDIGVDMSGMKDFSIEKLDIDLSGFDEVN